MNGSDLAELYKIRFAEDQLPRKNDIWRVICQNFLQKLINPGGTVVDIACGYGEFINNIVAKRKIAVDMNPDTRAFLSLDVEFHQCNALQIDKELLGCADTVFTSNFLEHLPSKDVLNEFLQQVMGLLKPGGKYIILGPNLRYIPGLYWDFYDHHLGLTHLALIEALLMQGFKPEICIDRFLPYTTQNRLPNHPWLVRLYLQVPWVWKIMGQQFLIVVSKPK
ncbi:bifunctional 2-polyprenyl-6-hydroxyphenol methylase/3-demethylubiquinol 3-O-methyltransferase UbiG [Polynucleobacter sp. AP-Latsch-80-C2]|jgi:SAM-dependent methyltransferase|uniref:class I SAM-dependent methyltransferase n=1 Tax=Polynucleobacter sp. AP-Latsch-80-C2 TaxID=2576931 RepID=UPI001C0D3CAE|nr:class I SAM-dependent methyltransferase [Polynucleobacter sp. AP-Latsch-80-C2]MBU3624397.1 class I SAM-dependent methyltransferase [Polynucleobacter sp. AP-Latsch-80-C2]